MDCIIHTFPIALFAAEQAHTAHKIIVIKHRDVTIYLVSRRRQGDAFGTTENAFFSCIYNHQITVSPISSFPASFNGNRVKNHP